MSPDNINLYRLHSRYKPQEPATPNRIQQQMRGASIPDQSIDQTHGHHHNKAEKARKNVSAFLRNSQFSQWLQGVEYNPDISNGDIIVYLNESTLEGDHLIELVGYSSLAIKVLSNGDRIGDYMDGQLKDTEGVNKWFSDKRVVLDSKSEAHIITADLLFQMWGLSENLFVSDLTGKYLSHFDAGSQMIMNTPDILRPVIRKRLPIVQALYPYDVTGDIDADINYLLKQFSLT